MVLRQASFSCLGLVSTAWRGHNLTELAYVDLTPLYLSNTQQTFIMQFASEADRDYYVYEEKAHHAFQTFVREIGLDKVAVLDFSDGVY